MSVWIQVFSRILKNGWYLLLLVGTFAFGISMVALLPNSTLIEQVFLASNHTLFSKLSVVFSLYGSIVSGYTNLGALLMVCVVALTALNITTLVYYIRRAQKLSKGFKRTQAGGLLAVISGAFGIGCAACGSVIVTSIATSLGVTGFLTLLPLHGVEFSIIALVLLLISINYLVHKINNPLTCRV